MYELENAEDGADQVKVEDERPAEDFVLGLRDFHSEPGLCGSNVVVELPSDLGKIALSRDAFGESGFERFGRSARLLGRNPPRVKRSM